MVPMFALAMAGGAAGSRETSRASSGRMNLISGCVGQRCFCASLASRGPSLSGEITSVLSRWRAKRSDVCNGLEEVSVQGVVNSIKRFALIIEDFCGIEWVRMFRSIHATAWFVSIAFLSCGSADAARSEQELLGLNFDGFSLDMTRTEVDRLIAAQTDISEPGFGELDSFDCSELAPATKQHAAASDPALLPTGLGFENSSGRRYGLGFSRSPDESRVIHVSYREKRGVGNWVTYLAEFEARFGKADLEGKDQYGHDIAVWCSQTEPCQLEKVGTKPRLFVTFLPDAPTQVERGDHVDFDLDEGSDRRDERRRFFREIRDEDPKEARRLDQLCRSSSGKFQTHEQAARYYLSLMPMGPGARPVQVNANDIPRSVFAALGIDRDNLPGPKVCFQSMDFFVEDSPCKAYSFVGFLWARRVDDYWLVALKYGGVSLRREYYAVRRSTSGTYEKVWWDDTTAGFNAWRENGGIPMNEAGDQS